MPLHKVPLYKDPRGQVAVEHGATKGATIGRNVWNADGTLFVPAAASSSSVPVVNKTLWELVLKIPANVTALQNATGTGLFAVTGSGTGMLRTITDTATIAWTNAGGVAGNPSASVVDNSITYAKMQDVSAASKLLGRGDSGGGDPQEISLGSGLSMSGTTLSASGSGGAMTLVGTATVAGSAATTLTLSSLDLSTDGRYIIECVLENPTASTASISMYYSGDTTATNYDTQFVTGNNTVAGGRANTGLFTTIVAGECTTTSGKIVNDRDGRPTALLNTVRGPSASIALQMFAHYWRTVGNVTSITISSSVASSLGVGSYLKVWKLT